MATTRASVPLRQVILGKKTMTKVAEYLTQFPPDNYPASSNKLPTQFSKRRKLILQTLSFPWFEAVRLISDPLPFWNVTWSPFSSTLPLPIPGRPALPSKLRWGKWLNKCSTSSKVASSTIKPFYRTKVFFNQSKNKYSCKELCDFDSH